MYMYIYLHAGQVLQPTGDLQGKVVHILHVHQALRVDVVMANGRHRVGHGDGCAGVLGSHFQVSPIAQGPPLPRG